MNKKVILGIGVVVLIFAGVYMFFSKKTLEVEVNNSYSIIYNDNYIPGSKSEIKIYDDKLEITTTHFCSVLDCESKIEKEIVNYSKENIIKLKTFINDNFSKSNIEVNQGQLSERQQEIIQSLLYGESFFEIAIEDFKYKVEFSKNESLYYVIYLKDNNSILVKKMLVSDYGDMPTLNTYFLKFSTNNLKVISNYIEKEVKNSNSNVVRKNSTLTREELNIFNSITENNETYLSEIEIEPILSYTISYNGINCPTPTLYLYSDNTYKYYYTLSTTGMDLTPKTGTYNYDFTQVINNIDKYEANKYGPYTIEDSSGKKYTTYNSNKELLDFFKTLDITLEKCLEQQN